MGAGIAALTWGLGVGLARHRTPWPTVLAPPWPLPPHGVRARRGMVDGPGPEANRFDLYTRSDLRPTRDGGVGAGSQTGGSGAQHGFDAVRSPRYLAVVDAVARFTDRYA